MNSFLLSNKNNLRKHGIVYVWKFGKLTALKSCVSLLLAGVRGVGWKENCLLGKQHIGVLGVQALYFSLRVGFSNLFLIKEGNKYFELCS